MNLTNVVNKNNCTIITLTLDRRHHWLFYCACQRSLLIRESYCPSQSCRAFHEIRCGWL